MTTVKKLKEKINKLWEQIDQIQLECKHHIVLTVLKADTGNYDPSDNVYWKDIKCQTCEKLWREHQ